MLVLALIRNRFYILFPVKSTVSYRQIISGRLYVRLKGTCSHAHRALAPGDELNNLLIISKFRKSIAGRTKCPRGSHVARACDISSLGKHIW